MGQNIPAECAARLTQQLADDLLGRQAGSTCSCHSIKVNEYEANTEFAQSRLSLCPRVQYLMVFCPPMWSKWQLIIVQT